MAAQEEYKVKLDVFEGPLDLLLYLIKKEEVDIYNIPIERITTQYMDYLGVMQMLDLNIAGEFLVMAATLMLIKSRMLLPVEERKSMEGEEEEEDPRWDLVRQLVEYKKFKDAALHLHLLEGHRLDAFTRDGDGINLGPSPDKSLQDVGIFDLITAFNQVLSRVPREDIRVIFAERVSVSDKIEELMKRLKDEPRMTFLSLFDRMVSRHEIVVTFLAMLELMRLKHVVVRQESTFGEIRIIRADLEEAGAAVETNHVG